MLLGEPPRTQFDLHFSILKFGVRITPFFWLAALILGWEITGGSGVHILIWTSAVLLSLLIHELGHAVAFRRYGVNAHVVLYHFGGLAVPTSAASWMQSSPSLNGQRQIVISAAGPIAQLLLAAIIIGALRASGHGLTWPTVLFQSDDIQNLPRFGLPFVPPEILWGKEARVLDNAYLNDFCVYLLLPSVFWAVMNLVPVYPLDGGQIAREVFTMFDPYNGIQKSLILSIGAGAAVAVYGVYTRQMMLGIMFGLLAFSSYQILQAYSGRGGGFGGGWGGGGRPW